MTVDPGASLRQAKEVGESASAPGGVVTGPPEMGPELALSLYRTMLGIRVFEESVARLTREGNVPGFVHLSLGSEGSAAGVMAALDPRDVVLSGHRSHGHILARGSDPERVLAEILGRSTGLCGGLAGSMHLVDTGVGFLTASGVVGGTLPLAVGAAMGTMRQGGLAAVFFGDGATTTGVFHESLNLAAVWGLPVLFCCENNGFAEFTERAEQSPVAEAYRFAQVYGMGSACVDGADVEAVWAAAGEAAQAVRAGAPYFLELRVVRLAGHYEGDSQAYRSREERAAAAAADPLARQRRRLLEHWGVAESQLAEMERGVRAAMGETERAALAAPWPAAEVAELG
jgi:TPP-dependent pyruvate/acetoin dehydrogenase alpha subunit